MTQDPNPLQGQRDHIMQLLSQLTADYPTLKSEIRQIAQQYPGSDNDFAFLEEFELLIVTISGYAKQIQVQGSVRKPDLAIAHLHQLQVFGNPAIAQFDRAARTHYPNVQAYLQRCDYLRLLLVEYLQTQRQPLSA